MIKITKYIKAIEIKTSIDDRIEISVISTLIFTMALVLLSSVIVCSFSYGQSSANGSARILNISSASYVNNLSQISPSELVSDQMGIAFSHPLGISSKNNSAIDADVAADGNSVYIIWKQRTDRAENILFRRSLDGGATFDNTLDLSQNVLHASMDNPRLTVSGDSLFVTWDYHNGTHLLRYLVRSTDGGANFGRPSILSNNTGDLQHYRSFSASGDHAYFILTDNKTGNTAEYVVKSIDGGATFGRLSLLSNNTGSLLEIPDVTDISASGNNVYFIGSNNVTGTPRQFFARSIDSGATFEMSDIGISSIPGVLNPVQIASFGDNVYVVWSDDTRIPNIGIYLEVSTDRGANFSYPIKLSTGISPFILPGLPRIAIDKDNVYVVWRGISSFGDEIFFTEVQMAELLSVAQIVYNICQQVY